MGIIKTVIVIMLKSCLLAFFVAQIGILLGETEAVFPSSTPSSIPNDPESIEACLRGSMGRNQILDQCWKGAMGCDDLVRNLKCMIATKNRICGGDMAKNYTKWIYVDVLHQSLKDTTHLCSDRLMKELEALGPKPCERCLDFENIFYTGIGENPLSKHIAKYWTHENGCKFGELFWNNPEKSKIRLRLGEEENLHGKFRFVVEKFGKNLVFQPLKDLFLKCETRVSIFCDNNGKWLLEGDDESGLKNYSLSRIQSHVFTKSTGGCDKKVCELCLPFDKLTANTPEFWHEIVTETVKTKNGDCLAMHITWDSKKQSKILVKVIDDMGTTHELYLKCDERVTLFCNNDRRWRWENPKNELVYLKGIESEMLPETEGKCGLELCDTCPKLSLPIEDGDGVTHVLGTEVVKKCGHANILWMTKDRSKVQLTVKTDKGIEESMYLKCNETMKFVCNDQREWEFFDEASGKRVAVSAIEEIDSKAIENTKGKCDAEHYAL